MKAAGAQRPQARPLSVNSRCRELRGVGIVKAMRTLHTTICAAMLFGVLAATPSSADEPKPQFDLRQDRHATASLIRRKVVEGSPIPINKRYHELSPEAKAILHDYYENLAIGDEPPFPAHGLKPVYQALAIAQQKLLSRGELILVVMVDSNGNATEVKAIGSPSPEMTQVAASIILLTKFKPAVCGGQPCKMEYPLRFDFRTWP